MTSACSQVQDKLKTTKDWETVEKEQSLHELIKRIEKICVGFDDHRQLVYNLVQALKTLFLHTQSEKDSIEEYTRNFRSLWNTVEAFGGTPGIHEGLVGAELTRLGIRLDAATAAQLVAAEEVSAEQIKAALLISGADCRRYGKLKDELANSYLLGSDQYPNTLEKAARILSNYQVSRGICHTGRVQMTRVWHSSSEAGGAAEDEDKEVVEAKATGATAEREPAVERTT